MQMPAELTVAGFLIERDGGGVLVVDFQSQATAMPLRGGMLGGGDQQLTDAMPTMRRIDRERIEPRDGAVRAEQNERVTDEIAVELGDVHLRVRRVQKSPHAAP